MAAEATGPVRIRHSSWRDRLPDKSLLISGAFGGPLVIFLCTPLRNALTLGSQDKSSSLRMIYKKVFRGGLRAGWTGGFAPAVVAAPQFLALSPVYHFLYARSHEVISPTAPASEFILAASIVGAFGAGFAETILTYGSQSRNAQMAYNNAFVNFSSVGPGLRSKVPLNKTYDLWGAGSGAMFTRNIFSVMGARVVSPWYRENLQLSSLSSNQKASLCDISASLTVSLITAPVHQLFNFLVTTPEARSVSQREKIAMAARFLREQYFVPLPREETLNVDLSRPFVQEYSWRISSVAARDFAMRTAYITSVFTLFLTVERTLVKMMRD
eukprot:TRINITY_DN26697_c0_g1_i1.p1 TRINITY_DN26697_c0_g1~~TRINITY_DN26697_c0_g1_i1.p1  ORF type:complete len:355 (-),score=29.56 TRINITY_DN26697_c0_g1_i1:230-1210(-)